MTVGTKTDKYFTNPANKLLDMSFAPFDVHIIEFIPASSYQVAGYNNGWDQVWSNNGNGNLEDWQFRNYDKKIAGDFDGDGSEELLLIQNPNIQSYLSFANMYKYSNNKWNWSWSNNGTDAIGDWGPIREYDNFFAGNFVKESSGNQKTELLILQKNDSSPGDWASLYQYTGSTWTRLWTNNGNNGLGWWGLRNEDKWVVGDFNNDGQDDLLSIQAFQNTSLYAQMHTFNNGNWTNLWANDMKEGLGKIANWDIHFLDQFIAGKFNESDTRSYLLAFDGDGSANKMLKFDQVQGKFVVTPYSTTTGSLGGVTANPINMTHSHIVGNIDSDSKDEFFFVQRGANAAWAISQDLNTSMNGWNWNWVASPSGNCSPYVCNPFIDDWSIADQNGINTDYMLIKAKSSDPKFLLAFRSFGNNQNYLVGMYKTFTGSNYRINNEHIYDRGTNNDQVSIYPNPTSGMLHVNIGSNQVSKITVYDVTGRMIFERESISDQLVDFDMSNYHKGLYVVIISSNQNTFMRKFLLE